MAGSGVEVDGLATVVLGTLVLVGDGEENRGSESDAILGSRVDGDAVLLVAGSGDGRLARTTTVELGLDISLDEGEIGRAIVDNARDRFSVGLTRAVVGECQIES